MLFACTRFHLVLAQNTTTIFAEHEFPCRRISSGALYTAPYGLTCSLIRVSVGLLFYVVLVYFANRAITLSP